MRGSSVEGHGKERNRIRKDTEEQEEDEEDEEKWVVFLSYTIRWGE